MPLARRMMLAAWRAEFRASLALSWPIILTNLAQTAVASTDVMLMGWIDPAMLAAGGGGHNFYFALLIFGIGLVTATSPLIAVEIGRNRHSVRDLRRTVRQGMWSALAITVPMWIILWNGEPILEALVKQPALTPVAMEYVRSMQWSILPFLWYIVLRSFLAAKERPGWSLLFGLLSIPLNFLIAWTLAFGKFGFPQMGLKGIGLATFATNSFMFLGLACTVLCHRDFRRYHLFGHFWRADWSRFRAVWRVGIPIALASAFEVTVFNAAAFAILRISREQMSAHVIAIQLASIAFMVPFGVAQAATVRVGQAWGRGDPDGVTRAGWSNFALGVSFMAITATIMLLMPKTLIGFFIDIAKDREVAAYAVSFLFMAAMFQLADGAQVVTAGMLRGLHDTRVPMLIAAFGYWGIGVPLGFVLAFWTPLSGIGVWIGLVAGLTVVAALMIWRWTHRGSGTFRSLKPEISG